jgi:preprotein translocase subunit SecG
MTILFLVLIILCAVVLGFIILIQSPKGGGLAGNIAGFNNQFMGVKQTNDVLERGTWIFAGLIALLCLFSTFFMSSGPDNNSILNKINTNQGTTAPAQKVPTQQTPVQPSQEAPANAPR